MVELEVAFDFRCCACGSDMGVTLKCAGKGLTPGKGILATVKVPCPTCQEINRLYFSPDGTLHRVAADQEGRKLGWFSSN